nr:TPA_asm: m49.5 sORF 1 [Murid betaherpesvirus 1]DBA07790.1 TPA_asm: m49.5 sORF 1 [Murid betaherpesvirus 1]
MTSFCEISRTMDLTRAEQEDQRSRKRQ